MTHAVRRDLAAALEAAMAACVGRAMRWGVDDCATWAGDIVLAATGVDPMAGFRGRYTTLTGYRRVLRRDGFADLRPALVAVAAGAGWTRLDPGAPGGVGDIGLVAHLGGHAVAVSNGKGFWIARSPTGWAAERGCLMAYEVIAC